MLGRDNLMARAGPGRLLAPWGCRRRAVARTLPSLALQALLLQLEQELAAAQAAELVDVRARLVGA